MKENVATAGVIQVGNLPDSVDGIALQKLFETYGVVSRVSVNRHFETGRSTGVGFVEMASQQAGAAAIAALNHQEHNGAVLAVGWAQQPHADSPEPAQNTAVDVPGDAAWHSSPNPAGPKPGDFGDRG